MIVTTNEKSTPYVYAHKTLLLNHQFPREELICSIFLPIAAHFSHLCHLSDTIIDNFCTGVSTDCATGSSFSS